MSDQSEAYRRVTGTYDDAYRLEGAGLGLTQPAWLPQIRIDYVFHVAAFVPVSARVWHTSGGSDHLPVLVELALQTP
jgi:endonuclease/exonuclease/phosphatase family metal-dependent hydrolase